MLEILVRVPPDRNRAAHVRITEGSRSIVDDWAATTVDPASAQHASNPRADPLRPGGHPPFGRYELTALGPAPADTEAEYGSTLLLFEPVAGQALDAESYGRLGLLVYAGRMAPDTRLRRTQSGLRLTSSAMDRLLAPIDDDTPVVLHIEPVQPRPWWAFWRKPLAHPPLSERPPLFTAPPLDEATLLADLLRRSRRRARPVREDAEDWDRQRDRTTGRHSSAASDTPEVRGRGGEGGGAGASGGWTDAPAAGRGPGVDAAGRIVAAAGVAAVATAAALAARDAEAAAGRGAAGDRDAQGTGAADGDSRSDGTGEASDAASSGEGSGWGSSSTTY